MPELALSPSDAIDPDILGFPDGKVDRTTLPIASIPILVDPYLSVAVEEGFAEATHGNIRAPSSHEVCNPAYVTEKVF